MDERVRHNSICKALEEDLNPPSWPMQTPLRITQWTPIEQFCNDTLYLSESISMSNLATQVENIV